MHTHAFRAAIAAALVPLLASAAPASFAQPAPAAASAQWESSSEPGPWIYRGSDVPSDPEWRFGELANGLRYAVRHNTVPRQQLSIRVRIDAGSLHETDAERGFAHLIEHLTFRQSKYLGVGETIPAWQRLGATFGSDTNAETTPTQTVYKLDVPDMSDVKLDETFRLLSGMIIAPTLSEAGVRTEVPIVLAEMRERGGAAQRVGEASRTVYFGGQLLAERPPIGTEATLRAADQKSVRAFHRRWYRPDNTVITIVGDADPARLEQIVAQYFGDWKVPGKATPQPDFGRPVADAGAVESDGALAPIDRFQVLVEPDLPRNIGYAIMRPWEKVDDTIAYNQGLMIDAVAQAVINRRLEARARAGGSYLAAQVAQDDVSRSADATFVSITPLGDDWRAALDDVRAVIADALENPPTEAEIAREVTEFDTAFQVQVETREVMQGSDLADNIVAAVDIRETVASPETVLSVFRDMRDMFTPEAVLEHTRQLFTGTALRGLMVVPAAGDASAAALRAAMAAPVTPDSSARLPQSAVAFADLPAIGTPGTVTERADAGLLGIETLTLSNGVKAMLWANDAEPGRVSVRVRFGGGYSALAAEDAAYIELGEAALMGTGMGPLGQNELDRLATGRKLGLGFEIDDKAFVMAAETRAADLADQLYLFALKLADPRWDTNPVDRARAALAMGYESFASSPQGVLERDLQWLLRGRDPRFRTPDPEMLAATSDEGFRAVWEPALESGPIEVEIFGDFDQAAAIAALERSFGALSPRTMSPRTAHENEPQLSQFPESTAEPLLLTHRGDPDQAAAVVAWETGGGRAQIRESRQLEILVQLFTNRLFDAMRERLGASYAPNVASDWPLDRAEGGAIIASAALQPRAVPAFFEETRRIAADLAANPPTQEEIARVTEPLRQLISRAASGNGFWLNQLEGAAGDPSRFNDVRTILTDLSQTTPAAMQALAARYLADERAFRVAVLPAADATAQAGARTGMGANASPPGGAAAVSSAR